ncbi:V4R domain-containing protein [Modicisalibacter xianhensis]|uniref:V4R domain-containing protein n=2 Tax=Modicisalibacter xianhensis TaxID=442341 RepID=A0A1I3FYV9_9GAMM|nr:V4R domain-containing protein [Halomonas xianhensis]
MLLMPLQASSFFREELVTNLGIERAKGIFMRLGYYSGLQDAELGDALRDRTQRLEESYLAGPQLHALQGHVKAEPISLDIDLDNDRFYSEFIWKGSFEVDVWRSEGPQPAPVCWTLLGYACAYATHLIGREVQFREVECRGCGDAQCRIVGKLAHEWEDHETFASQFRADPLIDELYELQERIATLEDDIARTRGRASWEPIGTTPAFRDMLGMLDRVSPSEVPILLLGETGTGKEILARRIHDNSPRVNGPFIAINCAAIPAELIEAELFGVEQGAFTGATRSRQGRFERAHGGTLFLDELAELSPRAQAALLRVLQEHEIERVGGQGLINVDVRIVAATHDNLTDRVEEGTFRKDLYYRLNTVTLTVPPLRERREDIPHLADHFLAHFECHYQRRTLGFSDQALAAMSYHAWPGNIRELKNAIERGVILTGDHKRITERAIFGQQPIATPDREKGKRLASHGRLDLQEGSTPPSRRHLVRSLLEAGIPFEEIEQTLIEEALKEHDGNIAAAARQLGMTRAAFAYRLKKTRR